MYKVCPRKVVRDPDRGRTRGAAASRREEEGGGDPAGKGRWGGEGKVKRGGKGKGKRGVGGSFPSDPDSTSRGPERKGRAATTIWGQNPGTLRFRFPPMCFLHLPPPHLDVPRHPSFQPPAGTHDLSSGSPPPFLAPDWRRPGSRTPGPLPARGPERASPGQGRAGGGDARGARERGRWAPRQEDSPRLPPAPLD